MRPASESSLSGLPAASGIGFGPDLVCVLSGEQFDLSSAVGKADFGHDIPLFGPNPLEGINVLLDASRVDWSGEL